MFICFVMGDSDFIEERIGMVQHSQFIPITVNFSVSRAW